ncbi:MAG TPA: ATP-binding cassette domain-containing protein [Gemmataceae bacterium]
MIHVEHLSKFFGPILAVNDVSFQVEKNEIVGLLGNNGAGKTTIMRMLTTYLPASSGIARVDGFDVMTQSMDVRRRVGYLPESIPLYTEMRVNEYLAYRAKLKGVERKQRPQRLDYCLDRCKLREVQRRLLGTLSKGYRQRVGLADAMINDPPILILDEPTDGLDPGQKAETLGMLRELGRDHTIMLSSHLLSEVETLVQRVLIMRRGHLALARKLAELETDDVIVVEVRGPADQVAVALRNTEGVAQVTTKESDDGVTLFEVRTHQRKDLREQLSQRIAKNGWAIRRLDLRRRKLQDRWNEINNWDEFGQRGAASAGPQPARRSDSTAVTT